MQRHRFHAMGTEIECLVEPHGDERAASALGAVEEEFERLEALLSRFRPDSELSHLNEVGSGLAGEDLIAVTLLALAARRRTGGRFDPTVHDAVVRAGYDRTFEDVEPDGLAGNVTAECGGAIEIDEAEGRISLAPGFRLDLGGIAKGYAVDRACRALSSTGPCLVNAGGDLAVRGRPRAGLWPIAVATPGGSLTLGLSEGAIATSGRDRRFWRRGGEELHHLIDPGTGRPSTSDLVRVTVVADSAAEAEVLAKSLFLAGGTAGQAEAEQAGLAAVLVTQDGRTIPTGGLR